MNFESEVSYDVDDAYLHQSDDEYDALNDETFADCCEGDWETEHEKLAAVVEEKNPIQKQDDDSNDFIIEDDAIVHSSLPSAAATTSKYNDLNQHIYNDPAIASIENIESKLSALGLNDETNSNYKLFGSNANNASPYMFQRSIDSPNYGIIDNFFTLTKKESLDQRIESIWNTNQFSESGIQVKQMTRETSAQPPPGLPVPLSSQLDIPNNRNTIQRPMRSEDLEAMLLGEVSESSSVDESSRKTLISVESSSSSSQEKSAKNFEVKSNGWSPLISGFSPNIHQQIKQEKPSSSSATNAIASASQYHVKTPVSRRETEVLLDSTKDDKTLFSGVSRVGRAFNGLSSLMAEEQPKFAEDLENELMKAADEKSLVPKLDPPITPIRPMAIPTQPVPGQVTILNKPPTSTPSSKPFPQNITIAPRPVLNQQQMKLLASNMIPGLIQLPTQRLQLNRNSNKRENFQPTENGRPMIRMMNGGNIRQPLVLQDFQQNLRQQQHLQQQQQMRQQQFIRLQQANNKNGRTLLNLTPNPAPRKYPVVNQMQRPGMHDEQQRGGYRSQSGSPHSYQHQQNSRYMRANMPGFQMSRTDIHSQLVDQPVDEYAGLMEQHEKEWLIKIQNRQLHFEDPFKEDYYYATICSRRAMSAASSSNDDGERKLSLIIPERSKIEKQVNPGSFVPTQFEGSLGKLQVANVNCPRKLLDVSGVKKTEGQSTKEQTVDRPPTPIGRAELNRFRKLLLDIEKLYCVFLEIDEIDKRMGALPEDARKPHIERRTELCIKLYESLFDENKNELNGDIANVHKGWMLMYRSLQVLEDDIHKSNILTGLKSFAKKHDK